MNRDPFSTNCTQQNITRISIKFNLVYNRRYFKGLVFYLKISLMNSLRYISSHNLNDMKYKIKVTEQLQVEISNDIDIL